MVAVKTARLNELISFKDGNNLGNLICFKLDRHRQIDWFMDAGYGFHENRMIRLESGLLKNFSGQYFKGLTGLSWCHEARAIKGYLFIHI